MITKIVCLMVVTASGQSAVSLNDLDEVKGALQGLWSLEGKEQHIDFVSDSYTGGIYQEKTQLAVPIFTLEMIEGTPTLVWHEASRKSTPWKIVEISDDKLVVDEGGKQIVFTRPG